jgi:hypothetical protein
MACMHFQLSFFDIFELNFSNQTKLDDDRVVI